MKTLITLISTLLIGTGLLAQYGKHGPGYAHQPRVQVALLLDASGSMDGLLEQAKSQLWYIVNDLSEPDDYGRIPQLEFALYEYGKNNLSYRDGYMRQLVPFTHDLDWLAESLFSIYTNGGKEYCGQAIDRAVHELAWSRHPADLRMIYIAGNESFAQGRTDFRDAAATAYERGIYVNTIFCGSYQEGIRLRWEEAAHIGGGIYSQINQDYQPPRRPVGDFDRLSMLNTQLNQTYLPYGANGASCLIRQRTQDQKMGQYGQAYASERFLAKTGSNYQNEHWDLVDATRMGLVKIEDIPSHQLPREMQQMSIAQRKQYISRKQTQRRQLQREMKALAKPSRTVKQQPGLPKSTGQAHTGPKAPQTLDKAIRESVQQKKQELKQTKPVSRVKPQKRAMPVVSTPSQTRPTVKQTSRKSPIPSKPAMKSRSNISKQPAPRPGHQQSDETQSKPVQARPPATRSASTIPSRAGSRTGKLQQNKPVSRISR